MSKPVKELLRKDLIRSLSGVDSLAIAGLDGIGAVSNNRLRGRLREKGIRVRVVKNAMARQAFREIGLDSAVDLLDGPCAIVHGADSVVTVVRELLDLAKDEPNVKVKGALLEGEAFGPGQIAELSEYPTHAEAIGRVVALAIAPARRLAGCLMGPASKVAALIKAIEDGQSDGEADEEAA